MCKRMKVFLALLTICMSIITAFHAVEDGMLVYANSLDDSEGGLASDWPEILDEDPDDRPAGAELELHDFRIVPSKKTIRRGESFKIKIVATVFSDYADWPEDEWDELCKYAIDFISFRSTNSKVAAVNKKTGKVTGKRKGTARIKTTVFLTNGQIVAFKTTVYVVN